MKKLYIAILILMGILISGCSSGDDSFDIQPKQPVSKDQIVTTTTMVSFNRAGSTRALTPEGVKTFAVGDQIAVKYTNTSDASVKVVSAALTAADIAPDGKSARFSVNMTAPKANGAVTYIYPAAMADANGSPNLSALDTQDGTLATLASTLDYAKFTGTLTAGAKLPSSAWLANQLTLCEFNIKKSDGSADITNTVTQLIITNGSNTYTVNRQADAGPIYVAMQPVTTGDITLTATAGVYHYERTVTGETLSADYLYTVNVPMYLNQTFDYTGAEQTLAIPATGWYTIQAYGAEGGESKASVDGTGSTKSGGKGGYSTITYYLTNNQTLYIYCGGKGGSASCPTGGAAGWNGGGAGGNGMNSSTIGGGGGGGATHVATSSIGVISSSNSLFDGTIASPTAKSGLVLVAGGGGGNGYNGCVAGDGGGDSWTVGKRASDGDADANYKNGTNVTFTGSQGGTGKTSTSTTGNQKGGSGGHGGGFKAVSTLKGQQQTYAGCGGSGWGDTTNGKSYTTTTGGATAGGNGKVIITWISTPMQGANDYTVQSGQSW